MNTEYQSLLFSKIYPNEGRDTAESRESANDRTSSGIAPLSPDVSLNLDALETHGMIMGPLDSTKTNLARLITGTAMEQVKRGELTLIVEDGKTEGDLYHGCLQDVDELGLDDRTMILDTDAKGRLLTIDPTAEMGAGWDRLQHAEYLSETFRYSFNSQDQEILAQLRRWCTWAVHTFLEAKVPLCWLPKLLYPSQEEYRQELYRRISFSPAAEACEQARIIALRLMYEDYEGKNQNRQDQVIASTLARIEPFCYDPVVRRILCGPDPADLDRFFTRGGVLLSHIPLYRSLSQEKGDLTRAFLIRTALGHVRKIPASQRPPVLFVIDEAQKLLEREWNLIINAMEDRTLGVRFLLIFHSLNQVPDPRARKLIKYHCQTKFIAGNLDWEENVEINRDIFMRYWKPDLVRHSERLQEITPVEETRVITTYSKQRANLWDNGETEGEAVMEGEDASRMRGGGESCEDGRYEEDHVGTNRMVTVKPWPYGSAKERVYDQDDIAVVSRDIPERHLRQSNWQESVSVKSARTKQSSRSHRQGGSEMEGVSVQEAPFISPKVSYRQGNIQLLDPEPYVVARAARTHRQRKGQFLAFKPNFGYRYLPGTYRNPQRDWEAIRNRLLPVANTEPIEPTEPTDSSRKEYDREPHRPTAAPNGPKRSTRKAR